jgi:predicted aspartyl protease
VGIFSVGFTIRHKNGTQLHALNGVVDTGSSFVIIPEHILDEMGVERDEQALFRLADGSVREMFLGETLLDLQDRTKTVQVVFGPDPRKVLLGAMALEAFGLAADAKNHRLIPAELML